MAITNRLRRERASRKPLAVAAATTGSVLAAVSLAIFSGNVAYAGNLVQNGDFSQTTNGNGQLGFNTNATGWSTNGYNFLFEPGTADTTGATGSDGPLSLWGPGNGSANGMPATSPAGGNIVAADGAFEVGPITQAISGLTVGQAYVVSFYWAGAQQSGFNGATTEQWQVSLGSDTQSTEVLNNDSHGFTGWKQEALTFVASASSETLSFLAVGTPNGVPPFVLLSGVSMDSVAAPEPGTLGLLFTGIATATMLVGARRRRSATGANKA